jgi:hypothetical protein
MIIGIFDHCGGPDVRFSDSKVDAQNFMSKGVTPYFDDVLENPRLWHLLNLKGVPLRFPTFLFPKAQVQKTSKIHPRIIAGVSLFDQILVRMFFMGLDESLKDAYPNTPSAKGIGFNTRAPPVNGRDNNAVAFAERLRILQEAWGSDVVASDVSGWETVFNQLCAELTMFVAYQTTNIDSSNDEIFRRMASFWAKSTCSTCYVNSSGDVFCFFSDKVQRSGDFLTTTSNTIARLFLAMLVHSLDAYANGDDCLEVPDKRLKSLDALIRRYTAHGAKVRDVLKMSPTRLAFCSHMWDLQSDGGWHCYLESWERMIAESSFVRKVKGSEIYGTLCNYVTEVRDIPDLELRERIYDYLEEWASLVVEGDYDPSDTRKALGRQT